MNSKTPFLKSSPPLCRLLKEAQPNDDKRSLEMGEIIANVNTDEGIADLLPDDYNLSDLNGQ